jgi:photosystem II stability/assembly factor-like uncharacterized protein
MPAMSHRPIALLLLAALLAACGATPPATASPPPETPAAPTSPANPATPAPTPTPDLTPAPIPTVTFEPANVPDAELATAITTVLPGGDGLIAIGFDGAFGSLLWTSTDGRAWRDVTPADFRSMGIASAIQLADGRLLAVGRGDTIDIEADTAAAFVSDDGLAWRPVGGPDLQGQMIDVIETDAGLVAIGGVPGADAAGAWRSTDGGETWERTGDDVPGAFFWSVIEGGPGLVVSGWRRNPEPDAAVWTSADGGATWQLADDPEGFELAEGVDLLATDTGFVMAGGSMLGGQARLWTSLDGQTWTLVEIEGGFDGAMIRTLLVTPIGLLAVGAAGSDAASWLSTDGGATWSRFGDPVPEAYFSTAFATADDLFVGGATQSGTQETGIEARAATWVATLDR